MIVVVAAGAVFTLAAAACAASVAIFFGQYWYLILRQPDPDGPSYTLEKE